MTVAVTSQRDCQALPMSDTKVFNYTVATPEAVIALHGIFNTDRLVVIIVLTNKL